MIEIKLVFPIESDAHNAQQNICNFLRGSKVFIENNVVVTPIKKNVDNLKESWYFYIDISQNESDTIIENFAEIAGGRLNIVNKNRDVWAFS